MSEYIDDIEITDDVFKIFYQEATEEEKEERIKKEAAEVAVHKTGFEKQILWQLPDKGC